MGFKKSPAYKYINYGLSFGLTMVITLYLLSQGGKWLDNRLGTYPLFMIIGILLAIGAVFKQMITDLLREEKDDSSKK